MKRRVDRPVVGYYKRRLIRGGVWVPVLVFRPCPIEMEPETWGWIDRWFPTLLACTNGRHIVNADVVWTHLKPVTRAEYEYLLEMNEWAREHAPHEPQANPRKAVDLNNLEPLF